MQQDHNSKSKEDEKVIAAGFTKSRPIFLGSHSSNERKIGAFGNIADGLVNLGSNSSDEKEVLVDIIPKMKGTPIAAWFQKLEEINQSIQVENVELRRLLQEAEKEK